VFRKLCHFNKASRSVKHKEFTDQLSDYQLLKKKSVPWSNLELLWRTFTSEEAERDVPLLLDSRFLFILLNCEVTSQMTQQLNTEIFCHCLKNT